VVVQNARDGPQPDDWLRSVQEIQADFYQGPGAESEESLTSAPFMLISIVLPTNTALSDLIRTLICSGIRRKRRRSCSDGSLGDVNQPLQMPPCQLACLTKSWPLLQNPARAPPDFDRRFNRMMGVLRLKLDLRICRTKFHPVLGRRPEANEGDIRTLLIKWSSFSIPFAGVTTSISADSKTS